MFYKFFRETQDEHGISNKELMQETGISNKHLSQFRSGNASMSNDTLWKLVEAMDKLSPGAKKDFGLKMAGSGAHMDINYIFSKLSPTELLALLGNERFALLVKAFADSVVGADENSLRQSDRNIENTGDVTSDEPVRVTSSNNVRTTPSRNPNYEEVLAS